MYAKLFIQIKYCLFFCFIFLHESSALDSHAHLADLFDIILR